MERAKQLQEERMRELAHSSEDTVVLEYAYDKPVRGACPEQALKLAKAAVVWRQGPEGSSLSDMEARSTLLEGTGTDVPPFMADFSKSFPKAFEMVTEKNRGPEHFQVLEKMARLAVAAEAQRIPEATATAQVNAMLQEHCARGAPTTAQP